MDALEQIAPDRTQGLRLQPQASVRCRPDAVRALGVSFFRDEDDFDGYQAAVLRLAPEARPVSAARRGAGGMAERQANFHAPDLRTDAAALVFMVQRYDHEPEDVLTVFLPERVADADQAMGRVLAALHLTPDHVFPQPAAA